MKSLCHCGFPRNFRTIFHFMNRLAPIGTATKSSCWMSSTPDFAEQLHLAIESEKMLHAVRERLSKREQIVVIFRYGLWGQEELTQQEIAGRLGISRSYVYRHIYCK